MMHSCPVTGGHYHGNKSGKSLHLIIVMSFSRASQKNRVSYGTNAITELKRTSIIALLLEGVREPMMVLLFSIAALSVIFGEIVEAAVMIFVVATYIFVEFINKLRTDSAHSGF